MRLGSAPRQMRQLWVVALVLTFTTGCGSGPDDPHTGATVPSSTRECNDMPLLGGDPGYVLGSHWSSDHQSWGGTVTVYACAAADTYGPSVGLVPPGPRVVVTPHRGRTDESHPGVYPFEVTVSEGASGSLFVDTFGPHGHITASVSGPTIQTDGNGWHFVGSG